MYTYRYMCVLIYIYIYIHVNNSTNDKHKPPTICEAPSNCRQTRSH